MPEKALWRKVFECPTENFEHGGVCHYFRQAKIGNDDLKEREYLNQKILRLEIAVCYPLCMKVTETVQYQPKSGDVLVIRYIGFRNVTMLVVVHKNKGIRRLPELNHPHHVGCLMFTVVVGAATAIAHLHEGCPS
jgi:hypothetical protein